MRPVLIAAERANDGDRKARLREADEAMTKLSTTATMSGARWASGLTFQGR
jgi:hypothetical protein